jgi:hypothetical protein
MSKHKKYYGGKDWSETLYFYRVDEYDINWEINKNGDTEFYLLSPNFRFNDSNSFYDSNLYGFDDTNLFITDTEVFNWYKNNRI